ncbi:unnamed protein product [Enterobius vermicularis]|uniref:Ovule protein n=1 Tax=Enterobius vermicularis TaxID=51028 RepID=A0A0N4VIE6_ENTVE|nr:unnamed protein product [Enterobius vermicularis]
MKRRGGSKPRNSYRLKEVTYRASVQNLRGVRCHGMMDMSISSPLFPSNGLNEFCLLSRSHQTSCLGSSKLERLPFKPLDVLRRHHGIA